MSEYSSNEIKAKLNFAILWWCIEWWIASMQFIVDEIHEQLAQAIEFLIAAALEFCAAAAEFIRDCDNRAQVLWIVKIVGLVPQILLTLL